MKAKGKRLVKRLFRLAKLPLLIGVGLVIGLAIGSAHSSPERVIVYGGDAFAQDIAVLERQMEMHMEQRMMPEMPEMPVLPEVPDFRANIHIVERGPTVWDVLDGIGTILASLLLIWLGGTLLRRHWQQPKEKSPESVGA